VEGHLPLKSFLQSIKTGYKDKDLLKITEYHPIGGDSRLLTSYNSRNIIERNFKGVNLFLTREVDSYVESE
jgi:hypothetical protein